jgi:hypothetical protein
MAAPKILFQFLISTKLPTVFCSSGGGTQGFVCTGQVLYTER